MDVHSAKTMLERIVSSPWTLVVLSWLGAGLLMWLGAHLAGLDYVTFGRSLLAAIAASTVTWIVSELFPTVTLLGISVGVALGLLLTWFVIKEVFNTTFGKAFLAWVFSVFVHAVGILMGISSGRVRNAMMHLLG